MRQLVVLVILLSPALLAAQDARLELTPTLGYIGGGQIQIEDRAFTHTTYDTDVDAAGSYSLVFGIPLAPRTWLELMVNREDTALKDSQGLFGEDPAWIVPPGDSSILETDVTYYHLGGQWELTTGPNRWFLTGSAGVTHFGFAVPLADDTRLSISGGGGLKMDLTDRLGLRFGARVYYTDTDEDTFRVQQFQHQDCGATCSYVYSYQPDFLQTELSIGLTIKL
jgi:hypothetical protein